MDDLKSPLMAELGCTYLSLSPGYKKPPAASIALTALTPSSPDPLTRVPRRNEFAGALQSSMAETLELGFEENHDHPAVGNSSAECGVSPWSHYHPHLCP